MMDAVNISLSGLQAEQKRAAVAADNIANAGDVGALSAVDGPAPYTPRDVVTLTGRAGGVVAKTQNRDPAADIAYDAEHPYADDQGRVAIPNVSLDQEILAFKQAELAYKANAKVLKVAAEMQDEAGRILDKHV